MPVQSNAVLSNDTTFANAVVQWQIDTEMNVEYHYSYIHPNISLAYNRSFDPVTIDQSSATRARIEKLYGYSNVQLLNKFVSQN